MKTSFKNHKKVWLQLTDGSAMLTDFLYEKSYEKLTIDVRSHKSWRFSSEILSRSFFSDKRTIKFNSRFNKKG